MGVFYFHQTTALNPPQNLTIETIGIDVHLSWDTVDGASSYKVYSSDDPYTGFEEDTSGTFTGENWTAPIVNIKKFYYVIDSTETERLDNSGPQVNFQPKRRSISYDSEKFINRKRKKNIVSSGVHFY